MRDIHSSGKAVKTVKEGMDSEYVAVEFHSNNEGIIHRDIKLGNLVIAQDTDGYRVKYIDFGIAILTIEANNTLAGRWGYCGTDGFIPPEMMRGSDHFLSQSENNHKKAWDIWSLGRVIYALITGFPPLYKYGMDKDDMITLQYYTRNVPNRLCEMLEYMMHPNPARRPTAEDMLEKLGENHTPLTGEEVDRLLGEEY